MVYQDVQDEECDDITIGGLIIDKPDETTLMIAWKSGVNTTANVTLPSMPEYVYCLETVTYILSTIHLKQQ